MRINGNEIRPGMVLEYKGNLWRVSKISHTQPGKGGAYTQAEMKDIVNGTKLNERFRSDEKVEKAHLEARDMQYLYNDGSAYSFMDTVSYEQVDLSADFLEGLTEWLRESMEVMVLFYGEKPVTLEIPEKMEFTVTATDAVIKGQTVSSSYKPATLDNGVQTQVPPFITTGEKIIVNTADASYVGRA